MEIDHELVEKLRLLHFTEHEARIYVALCSLGEVTGYQLATATGLPRANVYSSLRQLVAKGAALRAEGRVDLYRAQPFTIVAQQFGAATSEAISFVLERVSRPDGPQIRTYNLVGRDQILATCGDEIRQATRSVFLDCWTHEANALWPLLKSARSRGVRVVTIVIGGAPETSPYDFGHPMSPQSGPAPSRDLTLVADERHLIAADLPPEGEANGVSTQNASLIRVAREAFEHDLVTIVGAHLMKGSNWQTVADRVAGLIEGK